MTGSAGTARVHTKIPSPLGELTLVREGEALSGLYFPQHWYLPAADALGPRDDSGFDTAAAELQEYFAGTRHSFEVPIRPRGDAAHQAAWLLVAEIPYGKTTTYGALGAELRIPAKDVGALIGRNPLCILIPCHRVIGATGRLTGYAGGLARKRALLELECALAPQPEQQALWTP
jgi:methylated-DNA-[protein]-cysteine S-methyltransferase